MLKNLDEIGNNIISLIDEGYEYLIFDSLSNVLTNFDNSSVNSFLEKIFNKLSKSDCRGIFYYFKK